jgi:hypothetical protein
MSVFNKRKFRILFSSPFHIVFFQDMASGHNLVDQYCVLDESAVIFSPEKGSKLFLRNTGTHIADHMVL